MKLNAERLISESRFAKVLQRAEVFAVTAALSLFFAAGMAEAEDHGVRHAGDDRQSGSESKIYGIVEKTPRGEIGTWIVSGREIVVTKDTRIKEKHGKAEAGAYVEVEGIADGKTFTAYEVKVKRATESRR